MMSINLKAFTEDEAALLGYNKAPDAWVKIVYKFPLRLRLKSYFYRLWVRIRYGLKSGEMWWSGDEPDFLPEVLVPTGDVPCIGTPPQPPTDLGTPSFDPELCREQEKQLQRYMDIAQGFQSERPVKKDGS
jgi:hypothetical protein